MMNRTRLAALGLVVACGTCLVLATGMTKAGEKESKQITLTEKDSNTTQKLSAGELLVVQLESQPGTAFRWVLAKTDREQLTLVSKILLDNPHMAPGGKAVQVFTFRATKGGTCELELHYKRSFDKGKEPAKTFKVTITDEKESKQITLTEKDSNSTQKLALGELLVVQLETQPSTAFRWVLAKSARDQLTLVSKILLDNPNMIPGGKAVQVFTFRADKAGMCDLVLHYKRPFDKGKEPTKTFKITATIE